jgi:peptidoglycan/xylan/chitin deacetylase (PgdA/CDA1 family)
MAEYPGARVHTKRFTACLLSAICFALSTPSPPPVALAADDVCTPDAPRFQGRLADLATAIGSAIGDPLDCPRGAGDQTDGDLEQPTTTGLAYADGLRGDAGFTNGFERWYLDADGLWYFSSPDAPPEPLHSIAGGADLGAPQPLLPLARSVRCPVLYTHEVGSQANFSRLLSALLTAGYHPVSLASVDLAMQGQTDVPRGCLVLSFDDALLSQYTNAMPVLARYGVPAAFFVMPDFSDGVHRYMGEREIKALHDAGLEVEAHTCHHANLVRLAPRGDGPLMAELLDCKRRIESIIGAPVDYLAYPDGATSPSVLNAVARAGYRAAFTTRPSALLAPGAALQLPRIRYDINEAPASVLRRIKAAGG